MVRYYSNIGPVTGIAKYRDVSGSLGVFAYPGQQIPSGEMPIGRAGPLGPDKDGNAMFVLRVDDEVIEGLWLLVDREFRPVQETGRQPR